VTEKTTILAYVIGVALGDGNLSCPNGRATRLRITCDLTYPNLIKEIISSLEQIFPKNKISICNTTKGSCVDISVYSNTLNNIMPWSVGKGSKLFQQIQVPKWIFKNKKFTKSCLRGLLQTDGSIYTDRGYLMVNFTNLSKPLIDDVYHMINTLGYTPHLYESVQKNSNIKYIVRLSRNVNAFIKEINLTKT
jgi:DNA-binding transcriptional regulator WhiA